jgi:hypothetical protein
MEISHERRHAVPLALVVDSSLGQIQLKGDQQTYEEFHSRISIPGFMRGTA